MDIVKEIASRLDAEKANNGFEFHPFKIRWYNSCVQPVFCLPYHEDALCILVISIPKMFECTFKPFISSTSPGGYSRGEGLDPVDQCMRQQFKEMQEVLHEQETDVILDYELHATRRPKILVQTAGHVSGVAYYYQKEMISDPPWDPQRSIYGVSVHPKYGGWFAFRGVIVLKNLHIGEEFQQKVPEQCVGSEARIIELLERFNGNWKDWTYRDIMAGTVTERYSEQQKEYFATLPRDRLALIDKWNKEK